MPYYVARELIDLANHPKKPWVSTTDEGTGNILGVPESYYYFAKLDSTPICPSQHYKEQHQHVLGHTSHLPLTPGYTTSDDFGCDGDDTPHKPNPNNIIPNVIVANRTFNDPEPSIVDLVFFDYIEKYILEGLRLLGHKYRHEDVKQYMPGRDPTLTELIQEWASREWKGDC